MIIGPPDLTFHIVKTGTSIQVSKGGNGRVSSGQTINWTSHENFSLLMRYVEYEMDLERSDNPAFYPAKAPVPHGWTPMATSYSHTVGTGPYFIKYWVMLEDPAVWLLDPGIIIDN